MSATQYRFKRMAFVFVYLLVAASLLLPLPFGLANPALVFGLPAAMAWVILAMTVLFVALLLLYFGED